MNIYKRKGIINSAIIASKAGRNEIPTRKILVSNSEISDLCLCVLEVLGRLCVGNSLMSAVIVSSSFTIFLNYGREGFVHTFRIVQPLNAKAVAYL